MTTILRRLGARPVIAAAIGIFLGAVLAARRAPAAGCAPGFQDAGGNVCSATLVYGGAPVSLALPASVSAITATVSGAEGGSSLEEQVDPFGGAASPGGKGGRETAVVPIAPGATITVVVGQAGTGGVLAPPGFGGYGGGGHASSRYGGNGGGGSFVFDDAGVLVAAGGGGGGGYDYNPVVRGRGDQQAPGGAGSGAGPAGDGQSVAFCCDTTTPPPPHFPAGGGGGATPDGPGLGGHPALPPGYAFGQVDGDPGSGPALDPFNFGIGGSTHNGCCYFTGWAGGGGGGYFGGGGGGNIEADLEGGGGGGGAGFVTPTAITSSAQTGVQIGDGEVTIGYYVGVCAAPCTACSGPAANQCTACPAGLTVVGGSCVVATTTTTTTSTSTTLVAGVCGDAVLDAGEQCDDGAANGTPASCCTASCTFVATNTTCTGGLCDGAGTCVAGVQTVLGKSFVVKDPLPGVDASRRSIVALGKEPSSGDTIAGDPLANGATVDVIANGTTSTAQVFTLPAGSASRGGPGWKALGRPIVGYAYQDPTGANGPIKTALLKRATNGTFILKIVAKGALGPGTLPHVAVVPPAPGTDGGIVLAINGGDTYCVAFGGPAGGTITNAPTKGTPNKTFKIVTTTAAPTVEAGCPIAR